MQPGDIIFVDNYRMLHGELVEGGGADAWAGRRARAGVGTRVGTGA